jgi:hypothetical protein
MFSVWVLLWLATCGVVQGLDRKSEQMRRTARLRQMMVLQSEGLYSVDAKGRPTLTYFHADGSQNTVPWLRDHKYATHVFVYSGPEGRYRVSIWSEGPTTVKRLGVKQ